MQFHPAFQPGDVVWAHVNGFPWWPSYITLPEPGHLRELRIRSIPSGYHLVWFFCDNDRFSLMSEQKIRAWDDEELHQRARCLKGQSRRAYKEALDWIVAERRRTKYLQNRLREQQQKVENPEDSEDSEESEESEESGESEDVEENEVEDEDNNSDTSDDAKSDLDGSESCLDGASESDCGMRDTVKQDWILSHRKRSAGLKILMRPISKPKATTFTRVRT